jgi:protein-L-isoaspartate(D-aspartate) O-methyltransferase
MDLETAREQMIGQQLRAWDVLDERILQVMAALPRERFVPPDWQGLAYADTEIPLGHGKHLAPPKIQGRALQALLPQPDDRVLEIGCGTGYLTACLAKLAGSVTAIELDPELAAAARRNLAALDISNAEVLQGDGLAMEFPGRFAVVCVNGSLPDGTDRLERLLAVGGRLFAVTGRPPIMQAQRITRIDESEWRAENVFETCLPPLENARQTVEFVF